ncbi:MAG: outer envelope protein [Herbaspirillum sp.]|jgi:nucleoside-specific outer membrane channel protein Tsx|nr:outer envelope protein [Herbaspirillum sp.]
MRNSTIRVCGLSAISILTAGALGLSAQAGAADWSDTSLGYRYGTQFAEPYNGKDISKSIISLTHASGYKYGVNFVNLDFLQSNSTDSNAQEAYLVYRNTLDFGKITSKDWGFGPVKSTGFTLGFDVNTKNDPGYASKKRMLVAGPTLMMDVPGFLNISVLALKESNQPVGLPSRYTYKTHPMLNLAWGIPLGAGFSFEGFMNYIAAKGTNEFGGGTAPETNFDGMVMYDLGTPLGMGKNTVRLGFEYQYWRNKFGNPSNVPGSLAKTPMVRAEYHF